MEFLLKHFDVWSIFTGWFVISVFFVVLMSHRPSTLFIALVIVMIAFWKMIGVL